MLVTLTTSILAGRNQIDFGVQFIRSRRKYRGKPVKYCIRDRYDDDGYFPATPCCKRAVHEATAILEKLGHEIVFFQLPNLKSIVDMYFDHMLADSGETSLDLWEGEILDQVIISLFNWCQFHQHFTLDFWDNIFLPKNYKVEM